MAFDLRADGFGTPSETMPKPSDFRVRRNCRNRRETIVKPHRNHSETIGAMPTETTETPVYRTGFLVSHPVSRRLARSARRPDKAAARSTTRAGGSDWRAQTDSAASN